MDSIWLDKTREDRFVYEMIDPFNLSISRGYLHNIVSGSGKLTFGYETDTRVSGSFEAVDSGYEANSLIRIHHYVDAYDFHEELGTFFAKKDNENKNGILVENFTLTSMLSRVSDDSLFSNYPVNAGTSTKEVLSSLFSLFNMEYSIDSSCNNMLYPSSTIYTVGTGVLELLSNIASNQYSRLDVDGHGTILIKPILRHKNKPISERLFQNDGIILDSIKINDKKFDILNRILVTSTVDETTVYGYADMPATSPVSYARIGRRNTKQQNISDINPFTSAQASSIAKTEIKEYEREPDEYVFRSLYFPFTMGEVIELNFNNGTIAKGYMHSRTIDLSPGMICDNTLRGC